MKQKARLAASSQEVVRRRIVVHGHVQGVFFRAALLERARSLGLAGWVRNKADGTIEGVIEGAPESVEQLIDFAHEGPTAARVEAVDVHEEAPEGLRDFSLEGEDDRPAPRAEAPALSRIFVTAQARGDPDPFGSSSWRARPQVRTGDVVFFFTQRAGLAHVARAASDARRSEAGRGFVADFDKTSWFRLPKPLSVSELQAVPELAEWRVLPRLTNLDRVQPGPLEEPVLGALLRVIEERNPGSQMWLAAAPLVRRWLLPGFAADTTEGTDLLGVQERVDFLASVLAGKQLETPHAVGLFGDWGSGKSFFMSRMQERIAMLAEYSARAEEADEPSYYCSHVRQVVFNAWLYADSDIWPSLAARIFRSVTGHDADTPHGDLQRRHLSAYQDGVEADVLQAADQRGEAEREELAYEQRVAELNGEIARKRAAITERGVVLGDEAGHAARGLGMLRELGERLTRIGRAWRELRPADVLLLLVPLAVALLVYFIGAELWAALLAILSPVFAVLVKVVRYVDETVQLQEEVDELTRRRGILERERAERARLRAEAEERLESALAVPLLPDYAAEQVERWAGRERLGVVTEIRLAFERLSQLIAENRAARANGAASLRDHLPIDRVIVYVDDLDRCSHDVVVRVLESIKVLLDVPHFVVVVGVDSRWLFRAIQVHFADVLRPDGRGQTDDAWDVTPQNYLEKIFQYSFVLRPLEARGFERLMESLLTDEDEVATAGDAAPLTGEPTVPIHDADDQGPAADPVASVSEENRALATVDVDLTPGDLVVTRAELDFMKTLAPLYETPRAAKRLANVYRLVRVSVGAERLTKTNSYEPMLVLLSVAIAFPALAGSFLRTIARPRTNRWANLISQLRPEALRDGGNGYRSIVGELSEREAAAWDHLLNALTNIDYRKVSDLTEFAEWVDIVADFSFHPWQQLLPADTRG